MTKGGMVKVTFWALLLLIADLHICKDNPPSQKPYIEKQQILESEAACDY
jgi:hypothetical protein